ncbi:Rne/Rng family ribonuclease [Nocardioides antri]|uniref:Rne/Rng family ribonuclease n=1 Tax=Nocardioides antri TaxID=2607659 RepID=UPI00165FA584|nr:Rne/Rng family ribonuclease [Nocardioides antri]
MADTPVDTTTTETTPAEATAPEGSGDATPAEKPAAKKAPAKKAAAKKAPAKKAAAKKAPAKKAAAKKAAPKDAKPDVEPTADAPGDAAAGESDSAGPAVLFQTPEVTPPKKKAQPRKKAAAPKADQAEDEKSDQTEKTEKADSADSTDDKPDQAKRRSTGRSSSGTGGKPGNKSGAKDDQTEDDRAKGDTSEEATAEPTEADEAVDEATEGAEDGEGGTSQAARRRRRRGGRRRRKPSGQGGGANGDDDESDDEAEDTEDKTAGDAADSAETTDATDAEEDGGEQSEGGSSSSSRRRRRRRREGESGNGSDEPNTVTRVRKQRSPEDEITAVAGSTRLEAKKQRRREGREAGRRRAPIVSEAEFLARRESVERVMVVRQRKDLTQIAVLEDKVLVEHYVARESQTSLIGNVYLGRVQNVLPSMEAAFVDIGKGRNAVLYAGEVNWSALGHKEGAPRKIESVLQSGQTVLVQVTKDPIGHKGARLTSQVSLAGRFLVYVPDGTTSGISRKLPDTERGRLKALLKEIVPETAGVIVRTAAEGASEDELTRDVERLKARWEDIEKKIAKGNAPQLLYGEPDLTLKVVRDLFTEDFAKLVVQGEDAWETVHDYVEHMAPDLSDRLEHYRATGNGGADKPDVFAAYRIDEQIAKGLDRKVWLPSGGSLVIDRTEAMTVVDVNTGKFTGSGGNLEETVTKNNLEAAEEIVRQLRLRDIGGIIVVDFIDMVLESNRDLVLRRLVECLGRDRTRHQVAEVTSLGLVQMTRKRIGTGLLEAFSETCDHCQGRGVIVHDLPVEPRRGGGDDESRKGGRRRRGKGGQTEEPAAKAVPSPKDIAAMAKPPAPDAEEDTAEDVADEAAADVASDATPAVSSDVAAEDAVVEAVIEPIAEDTPAADAAATEEATDDVPEAPVTTVVTRTRRRAASRPAGPPATAAVPAEPVTVEPATDEAPVVPDAEQVEEQAEPQPAVDQQPPVVGDIGAPVANGAVEPNPVTVDPGVDAHTEEPHVEHVPIKKKGGARKR